MKENIEGFTLEKFVPSWPSAAMGTGIIPVTLYLGKNIVPSFKLTGQVFFGITLVVLFVITAIWMIRFVRHPGAFYDEIHHPVAGSFIPTMPIALIITAINFLVVGPDLFGIQLSTKLALLFFWIGSIGIYLFSWLIMPALFRSKDVVKEHGTFGWYIPPVSHLIIPVAGLEIIHKTHGSINPELYYLISLFSVGIGLFLFIFIGSNIFYRYLYHSSPMGKMAPTLMIGVTPTAILTIIMVKLNAALPVLSFIEIDNIRLAIRLMGPIFTGFSLWWLVLTIIKIVYAIIKENLVFTLSWWAFTFPVGAAALAVGALRNLLPLNSLPVIQISLTILLLTIWGIVSIFTVKGIISGNIFDEE